MLPGVITKIIEGRAARFAPFSTANWFIAGFTDRGPVGVPTLITSLAGFIAVFGQRLAVSPLYDAVETYFQEGGGFIYLCRMVGPNPVLATVVLDAAGGVDTLRVNAISPGSWGNDLDVEVTVAGGNFTIEISDSAGVLETSPALADVAAAVAWGETSEYVRLVALGAADPVAQDLSLTGGTDDRNNAVQAQTDAALAAFTADYGPGQVSLPGFTTAGAHGALLAHANSVPGRIAKLDAVDTSDDAALIAAADALASDDGNRFSAPFAPWDQIPGLSAGTVRTVPPSARNAALYARSLATGGTVGDPAAGGNLPAKFVTGLSQPAFSDAQREALNDAGVNVSRVVRGEVVTYGNRTLADLETDANWAQLSQAQVCAHIAGRGEEIGEKYVHSKVDGRRIRVGKFVGELQGVCQKLERDGDIYPEGDSPAFTVTPSTEIDEAGAKVLATVEARVSPGADRVEINIYKTPSGV